MSQQQEPFPSDKQMANFLMIVVSAWAMSVQIFLRRGIGPQLLAVRGGWAALLLFCAAGFAKDRGLLYYLGALVLFMAFQRAMTAKLMRGGERMHSRYDGTPILAMKLTRNMASAKGVIEPVLCIALGIAIACAGEANRIPELLSVGGWVLVGGICSAIDHGVYETLRAKRLRDAEDAEIESEAFMEDLRSRKARR